MDDIIRHQSIFNGPGFKTHINIVGLGAVGSKVFAELVRCGILPEYLHLFDGDDVESHNIPNQAFLPDDVGKPKVVACAEMFPNISPNRYGTIHHGMIGLDEPARKPGEKKPLVPTNPLAKGITFLCVDSIKARENIFQKFLHNKLGMSYVFEARMGITHGQTHAFDPSKKEHVELWQTGLLDDESIDANEILSPCGSSLCLGFNTGMTACVMMSMFFRWNAIIKEDRSNKWLMDEANWKHAEMVNSITFSTVIPDHMESVVW